MPRLISSSRRKPAPTCCPGPWRLCTAILRIVTSREDFSRQRLPAFVAQVSKPAASPTSKSAERPQSCNLRVWKPATQQTWTSALLGLRLRRAAPLGASQFLAGLNAPSKNPKGIPSQSPGSRGTSHPGLIVGRKSQPQRGCVHGRSSQGSSFLATLG